MSSRIGIELSFGKSAEHGPGSQDGPLRVLVLGDLTGSGRVAGDSARRGLQATGAIAVDVDNFDAVLRKLKPTVTLKRDESRAVELPIVFESLGDFHPDHLYDTLGLMAELRDTRERLSDPTSFEREAARLLGDTRMAGDARASQEREDTEGDQETLERLLGTAPTVPVGNGSHPGGGSRLKRFISDVVAPHITPDLGPQQTALLSSLDSVISEQMRTILHAPVFQALESTWRALHWLVIESGSDLQVVILDAGKSAVGEDLRNCQGEMKDSKLYQLLMEAGRGHPGGRPWSLMVGDFTFDACEDDVEMLASLGEVAAAVGAPFLAAADPSLLGCDDLEMKPDHHQWLAREEEDVRRWQALRHRPVARALGLALPRIIGRLPYGKGSDPIERFDFTELPPAPAHERFLWMNPAFACARLICETLTAQAYDHEAGDILELVDLPLALYESAGGSAIKPCAEVFLSEASAGIAMDAGLMAFMSYRERNAARLTRFQSIADPPTALA